MPSEVRTPTPGEMVKTLIDARLRNVHTWLPAIVDSYDEQKQIVDCTAQIGLPYVDPEDGSIKYSPAPRVGRCPVGFMGAGGFRITLPIEPGKTTGVLLFAESPIVEWLLEGRSVDPKYDRRFDLSDAMFIPMLKPNSAAFSDVPRSDAMTVGRENGPQVVVTKDEVQLAGTPSSPPTDFVALASLVKDEMSKIRNAVNSGFSSVRTAFALISSHTHQVAAQTLIAAVSPALSSLQGPQDAGAVGDVKAEKTKAK